MSSTTVSVVIPVFNAQNTLERAVDSTLNQTLRPTEIILIDNNSSDGSPILIKEFVARYPALIKSITEKKPGSNCARNAGLKIATGSWIQLLDADDELLPNKLEHQLKILSHNPDVDLICSPVKTYSGIDGSFVKTIEAIPDIYRGLVNSQLGITSANLWRHSAMADIGFWDESRSSSQEYFTILKLIKHGKKILIDSEINTIVYEYPESVSKSRQKEREFSIIRNRLDYLEELIDFLVEREESRYFPEIFEIIYKSIYAHLINYGPESQPELNDLKEKYNLKLNVKLLLTTYLHQTYAEKISNKKSPIKYFNFPVEAIKGLNRLRKALIFLLSK